MYNQQQHHHHTSNSSVIIETHDSNKINKNDNINNSNSNKNITQQNLNADYKINNNELKILCFDLTHYNNTTQFLLCCFGVFLLYIFYGYMQELIFTLDGFKPYGWFLTLIQFGYYTGFGYFERKFEQSRSIIGGGKLKIQRLIPIRTYILLAFLTLGTMGLSNSSLGYLNYPTQVIFKCCKLVPVLIGSILIQRKYHGPLDFLAAIAMCVGLTLFTLGKWYMDNNHILAVIAI